MKNVVIILALFIVILSSCGKSGSGGSAGQLVQRTGACVTHPMNGEWRDVNSSEIVDFKDNCEITSDYCALQGNYNLTQGLHSTTLGLNLTSGNGAMGCISVLPGWDCSMNFTNSSPKTVNLSCDNGLLPAYQATLEKVN